MRTANDFGGNTKDDKILRWPGTETREISGVTTFGSASDCRFVNAVSPRCSKGSDPEPANGLETSYSAWKRERCRWAVDCAGAETAKHPRDCRAWAGEQRRAGGQAGRLDWFQMTSSLPTPSPGLRHRSLRGAWIPCVTALAMWSKRVLGLERRSLAQIRWYRVPSRCVPPW